MKTFNYHNILPNNSIKIFLLAFFLVSLMKISWAQSTFQRGYTDSNASMFNSAHQTSDGNFIAAGTTFPGNKGRICLIKTDLHGDTIWANVYGTIEHLKCSAMQQTSDNGFILGGRIIDSIIGDSKILLIKTDFNGTIVWSKAYNSANDVEILSIKETPSGDYYIAGNAFVGKINSSGNMIWSKDLSNIGVNVFIRSIDNTNDDGFILGGAIDTITIGGLNKPFYAYLLKMNSSGNIKWAKAYRSTNNIKDEAYSVSQTSDKGFILTGTTYVPHTISTSMNHIYLVKTDSLGNLTWSKKFDSGSNDIGSDVKQTSDGGYIITGTSNGFVGNGLWTSNSFLIKINSTGNVSWCKYYGSEDNAIDQSLSVSIANDGGYLVSGITTGLNGFPDNMYLLKTDVFGNVNCRGFNWPLYDSTYISIGNSINQTVTNASLTVSSPVINTIHTVYSHYGDCTVGLAETEKERLSKIYPNPNNGIFTISEIESNTSIKIYNCIGELVKTIESIDNQTTIDLSPNSNGIYYIKVKNKNGEMVKKLIKQQ